MRIQKVELRLFLVNNLHRVLGNFEIFYFLLELLDDRLFVVFLEAELFFDRFELQMLRL